MKNIVTIVATSICGVIILLVIMALQGRTNRSMEIKNNLPSAIEETLEIMALNPVYSINNANEFIADFTSNLSVKLDTDSDIRIKVLSADEEKGLLSIKVVEEYAHPNGNRGTVECERTVILNKIPETTDETYTVKFFLKKEDITSGIPYKVCQVRASDVVTMPVNPMSANGTFSGWLDPNDYAADFSVPVTGDLIYYATWN